MMRMSTSPSPGSGVGVSVNSKLPRLGAPSGRLFSKIWRLTLPAIDILLQVACGSAGSANRYLTSDKLPLSRPNFGSQRTYLVRSTSERNT